MNTRQALDSFSNSHLNEVLAADYAVESRQDRAILLIEKEDFRLIRYDLNTYTETETKIKRASVDSFMYHVEADGETPREQLIIKGGRKKIQITCSGYDHDRILRVYSPKSEGEA